MEKKEYTITLYTENSIGMIGRISAIFSRRKINVESFSGSPSEAEGIYRFTIVITETEEVLRKISRQFEKQVEVLKAYYNTNEEVIWQEQALFKVPTPVVTEKAPVERLLRQFGASAVVIRNDYTVFETAGQREEIDALTAALAPYDLIEFVRSARIAIIKDSEGFHKKLKEFEVAEPAAEVVENQYLDQQDQVFTM